MHTFSKGTMATSVTREESSSIWHLYLSWRFAAGLPLTTVDLCSCRSCRLAWPDTDRSRPPGPGVQTGTGGSWRTKRRRMREMVVMKMSVGWPCPSPPQKRKEILKGRETACRHAYERRWDKACSKKANVNFYWTSTSTKNITFSDTCRIHTLSVCNIP